MQPSSANPSQNAANASGFPAASAETLETSLAILQQVIDGLPQAIAWKDKNAVFRGCNRAFARAVGLNQPNELIGKAVTAVQWGNHPTTFLAAHTSLLLEHHQTHHHRLEAITQADGLTHWLDITQTPLYETNGAIAGILSVIEDVTDRKQAEEALRLTQFSTDRAADPVWWVEPDATIAYVNDAACRDLGYPREAIVGKRVFDFNPEFPVDAWLSHWQALKERGSFTIETLNQNSSGVVYPVEVTVNYIELNGKEFNCAVVRNITARKQAEAALRESEQQMREQAYRERLLNRLLSRIRDSLDFDTILETTLREVQNFVEADRCQFAWYDPNREDSYWEVIKETRYTALPCFVDRYPVSPTSPLLIRLRNQEILCVEDAESLPESTLLRFMRRFNYRSMLAIPMLMQSGLLGTIFCCHSSEAHIWTDSEIELIQAVMGQLAIALTQADLYKQSRAKAQELEQALRALQRTQTQMVQSEKMSSLGQLVAGVAHEINNPVNFIYGNLTHASNYTQDLLHLIQLYQQHYPDPVPEIQTEADAIDLDFLLDDLPKLLSSMKVGADRIQKIVLSLRNFSRMDEAEVKQVDIHEGIDSTLMILQSRFKGKAGQMGIALVKNYGQLPKVECYPGQLNQVFMNILANAIDALEESIASGQWLTAKGQRSDGDTDASDQQPTIRVETESLSDGYVAIKIADNGCGMTQAQQQRLFDPFFTTKPIGKGTGLGLSISYQIVVEKHAGSLTCFSAQGEGTEFCIEIPVQRPLEVPPVQARSTDAAFPKK